VELLKLNWLLTNLSTIPLNSIVVIEVFWTWHVVVENLFWLLGDLHWINTGLSSIDLTSTILVVGCGLEGKYSTTKVNKSLIITAWNI